MKEYFVCFLFKRNLSETKKQNKLYFLFKVASIDELAWSQKNHNEEGATIFVAKFKKKKGEYSMFNKDSEVLLNKEDFFSFLCFFTNQFQGSNNIAQKTLRPLRFS